MICICWRKGRSSVLPRRVMSRPSRRSVPAVGSIRRRMVRPTVVLPQPELADEAQGLARLDREAHVVDGVDLADRAAQQALAHGEVLLEAVDLQHGGGAGLSHWRSPPRRWAPVGHPVGMPAGGPVGGPLLFIGRIFAPADVAGEGAARREDAAGRQIAERRHHAGDLLQALGTPRASRAASAPAAGSSSSARLV